jgi:hypothetical protein
MAPFNTRWIVQPNWTFHALLQVPDLQTLAQR